AQRAGNVAMSEATATHERIRATLYITAALARVQLEGALFGSVSSFVAHVQSQRLLPTWRDSIRSALGYTIKLGDLRRGIAIRNSVAVAANWAIAMHDSTPIAAVQTVALPGEPVRECDERSTLAEPVCFGRWQRVAGHDGGRLRLRLRPAHANALAELLPVLLCGEES